MVLHSCRLTDYMFVLVAVVKAAHWGKLVKQLSKDAIRAPLMDNEGNIITQEPIAEGENGQMENEGDIKAIGNDCETMAEENEDEITAAENEDKTKDAENEDKTKDAENEGKTKVAESEVKNNGQATEGENPVVDIAATVSDEASEKPPLNDVDDIAEAPSSVVCVADLANMTGEVSYQSDGSQHEEYKKADEILEEGSAVPWKDVRPHEREDLLREIKPPACTPEEGIEEKMQGENSLASEEVLAKLTKQQLKCDDDGKSHDPEGLSHDLNERLYGSEGGTASHAAVSTLASVAKAARMVKQLSEDRKQSKDAKTPPTVAPDEVCETLQENEAYKTIENAVEETTVAEDNEKKPPSEDDVQEVVTVVEKESNKHDGDKNNDLQSESVREAMIDVISENAKNDQMYHAGPDGEITTIGVKGAEKTENCENKAVTGNGTQGDPHLGKKGGEGLNGGGGEGGRVVEVEPVEKKGALCCGLCI